MFHNVQFVLYACMFVQYEHLRIYLSVATRRVLSLMCSRGNVPQIARFLWCMIRLNLCHGKSVKRLAAYIGEYTCQTQVPSKRTTLAEACLSDWGQNRVHNSVGTED